MYNLPTLTLWSVSFHAVFYGLGVPVDYHEQRIMGWNIWRLKLSKSELEHGRSRSSGSDRWWLSAIAVARVKSSAKIYPEEMLVYARFREDVTAFGNLHCGRARDITARTTVCFARYRRYIT